MQGHWGSGTERPTRVLIGAAQQGDACFVRIVRFPSWEVSKESLAGMYSEFFPEFGAGLSNHMLPFNSESI